MIRQPFADAVTDPDGDAHPDGERQHEHQAGEVERYLVARHRLRAKGGQHQGHHGKQGHLAEDGHGDGETQPEQAPDPAAIGARELGEQVDLLEVAGELHIDDHRQQHGPQHDGGGHAAADPAQFRHAEQAVDEDGVGRDVDRQPHEADHHGRHGVGEPLTEVAQHLEQHEGGQPPQDGVQVAGGLGGHHGIHLHELQRQRAEIERHHGDGGDHQRQPEALVHRRAHLVPFAGAIELGDDGGECHDDALHQQDHRQPEAGGHRHGGQIDGADLSRHHGIDKVHGDLGHLGDQNGAG